MFFGATNSEEDYVRNRLFERPVCVLIPLLGLLADFACVQAESTAARLSQAARPSIAGSHSTGEDSVPAKEESLPGFRELSVRATALLKSEKQTRSLDARLLAAMRLVEFADHLSRDPRYPSSSTLRSTRRRVVARLRSIQQRTQSERRRQTNRPQKIEVKQQVLAQLNQAVNGGGRGANNNLAPADYGPLLVALIQRTISPSSWDVNGGVSTVRYWRPGMALVVRAPQDLHAQVQPLLGQLRVP